MSEQTSVTPSMLADEMRLVGAKTRFDNAIPVYDDGYGEVFIMRDSIGVMGIVRARTWEDAYGICEDEFFPEADETIEEIKAEYGFRREHKKVIHADVSIPESERPKQLGAFEKFAEPADYTDHGGLPEGKFIRWEKIETREPEAWADNELFQEAYGFRPNGPNIKDKQGHGIYAKDLNGEWLDLLTDDLCKELEITLQAEMD